MKVLKRLGTFVFFRISLFFAFLTLAVLVLLSFVSIQGGKELRVAAQMFSAIKTSGPVLREFSQLKTLVPIEKVNDMAEVNRKKIDEMFVRYYLALRYEQVPDFKEMAYRWGRGGAFIFTLSSFCI